MLRKAIFAFKTFQLVRKYNGLILALIAMYLLAVPVAVVALIVGLIGSSLGLAIWVFVIAELVIGFGVWAGRTLR